MKPLTCKAQVGDNEETVILHCTHADKWPPVHAKLGQSFEEMRAAGAITNHKYEQLKTWEKVCGLTEMAGSKCGTCPLALRADRRGDLHPFGAIHPLIRKQRLDWAKPPVEAH
jgi:hypothetical protein